MTNEERLKNALKFMLRDYSPQQLGNMTLAFALELKAQLPKEQGGSVVSFEARPIQGKSGVTMKGPKKSTTPSTLTIKPLTTTEEQ
jgi:hypothetical protein